MSSLFFWINGALILDAQKMLCFDLKKSSLQKFFFSIINFYCLKCAESNKNGFWSWILGHCSLCKMHRMFTSNAHQNLLSLAHKKRENNGSRKSIFKDCWRKMRRMFSFFFRAKIIQNFKSKNNGLWRTLRWHETRKIDILCAETQIGFLGII